MLPSASTGRIIRKRKDVSFYDENDESRYVYRLKKGLVILTRYCVDSDFSHGFGLIQEGGLFGEETVVGLPRQHTAEVIHDAEIEELPSYDTHEVLLAAYQRGLLVQQLPMLRARERLRLITASYPGIALRIRDVASLSWCRRETASHIMSNAYRTSIRNRDTILKTKTGCGLYHFELGH